MHLRSLSRIDDPVDGDRVRHKRLEQAQWLAGWIQQRQRADSSERLVVLGDLNAFELTDGYVDVLGILTGRPDPRGALLPGTSAIDPELTNLTSSLPDVHRYSFVYSGSSEALDHVLVGRATLPWVRLVAKARGNADSPRSLELAEGTPLRSSDHDGLVLHLGPPIDRWRRTGV